MATLDWRNVQQWTYIAQLRECEVESIPRKCSGAWVFKDTRMPVSAIFENLKAGATIDEIVACFHLTKEQLLAVLEFAARSLYAPDPPEITSIYRPEMFRQAQLAIEEKIG